MTQRSLQELTERAAEDAADLTVQHVWPDFGYGAARDAAVGDANLILHIDTSIGRHTSLFRKTATVRATIGATMVAMELSGAHGLEQAAVALTPIGNDLDSFGLANDDVLDLVAA